MYLKGKGVGQGDVMAASLFELGCNEERALGCTNLGYMYEKGKGVTHDYRRAVELFEKGCSMGNKLGCDNLAKLK